MRRMRARSAPFLLMLLLVACGTPPTTALPLASDSTAAAQTEQPSPSSDLLAEQVDIGNGRLLYLVCRGEGSPMVLFEAGDTDGVNEWDRVATSVATVTRTCAYDRAGIGRSSPAIGCRRLPELTGDLEALIEAAEI